MQDYEVTSRLIRTVYFEVINNVPFDSHDSTVIMQKKNGAVLGSHHSNARSAIRMMESISRTMHNTLLHYIMRTNGPLSIIVDTSTDESNTNYLMVYFRSLEMNRPHSYFYRAIKTKKETSEHLFSVIVTALRDDNIYDIIIRNVVGFASDGAPVML
jgi:hypothetical protein